MSAGVQLILFYWTFSCQFTLRFHCQLDRIWIPLVTCEITGDQLNSLFLECVLPSRSCIFKSFPTAFHCVANSHSCREWLVSLNRICFKSMSAFLLRLLSLVPETTQHIAPCLTLSCPDMAHKPQCVSRSPCPAPPPPPTFKCFPCSSTSVGTVVASATSTQRTKLNYMCHLSPLGMFGPYGLSVNLWSQSITYSTTRPRAPSCYLTSVWQLNDE